MLASHERLCSIQFQSWIHSSNEFVQIRQIGWVDPIDSVIEFALCQLDGMLESVFNCVDKFCQQIAMKFLNVKVLIR